MVLFPPPFYFVFDISTLLSYIQNNFSYELARPIMGTIFLVYICIIIMYRLEKLYICIIIIYICIIIIYICLTIMYGFKKLYIICIIIMYRLKKLYICIIIMYICIIIIYIFIINVL